MYNMGPGVTSIQVDMGGTKTNWPSAAPCDKKATDDVAKAAAWSWMVEPSWLMTWI